MKSKIQVAVVLAVAMLQAPQSLGTMVSGKGFVKHLLVGGPHVGPGPACLPSQGPCAMQASVQTPEAGPELACPGTTACIK
jgi:hypothetical protein